MNVVVFAGPTLAAADARLVLDADFRPPVAQGDVYAAAASGARVIGIIDGYFERVPAVWHKEILWAMSQGVHVFGAASMGALRAAELHAFGMNGVGRVFEAFRDGVLEDDDEVTVVHGAAETGYRAASEALVNMRWTLAAARDAGVIGPATEAALVGRAKRTFYPHRGWRQLLTPAPADAVGGDDVPAGELGALAAWLPAGRVDRKRLDALEMLERIGRHVAEDPGPMRPQFRFQHTDAWEEVRRQIDAGALAASVPGAPREHAAILDELRLLPDGGAGMRQAALLRSLALALADEHAGDAALEQAVAAFRARHGIEDGDDVVRWRQAQHVGEDELLRLLDEEARIRSVQAIHGADLDRHIAAALRLSGEYGSLAERAHRKQQVLAARGLENPSLLYLGLTEDDLWTWYFSPAGGGATPDTGGPPADLAAAATARGFGSVDAMRRAVLREFCFRKGGD